MSVTLERVLQPKFSQRKRETMKSPISVYDVLALHVLDPPEIPCNPIAMQPVEEPAEKSAEDKRRLRVYVAGAYSADNVIGVLGNMRRGMALSLKVLQAGFAPFVPWFDYHFSLLDEVSIDDYYAYSMAWLEASDAILIVPEGWRQSQGVLQEFRRARNKGIPAFFNLEDLKAWARYQAAKAEVYGGQDSE